jgi:hypothetical protein
MILVMNKAIVKASKVNEAELDAVAKWICQWCQEWTNCSNKNEIKIRLMALSCAIFCSCSSELEPTVAPILVDDCSCLTLNSVGKSIKLQITLVFLFEI